MTSISPGANLRKIIFADKLEGKQVFCTELTDPKMTSENFLEDLVSLFLSYLKAISYYYEVITLRIVINWGKYNIIQTIS